MSMIPSSGFFVAPQLPSETHDSGLDCLCEPADGSCILLKGSREDRLVVYKALKAAYRDDPVCRRILRREYEIGRFLKHPGICEILDWVHLPTYGDAIEMEYIEGSTLDAWLGAHRNETAKQRKILTDLCDALEYLHRKQVVHKDLKPTNILITKDGNYPKIIDFGLSDTDSILTGKDPGGTVAYAAPEVLEGGVADVRSDIYSLGCILLEMAPAFSRIARKCTSRDAAKRYPSAAAVRSDIERMGRTRFLSVALPLAALAAAGAVCFFSLREDPVEQLFMDAVEQVREAATKL